ncbi:uncharacterized protein V1510DRAFT_370725 [Dipodascopsis tothii]|uniref:uncharacterized protein n=1 Tax=Dipodascopsis tothii TaxID=44089 RepID=UPI0034CF68CE
MSSKKREALSVQYVPLPIRRQQSSAGIITSTLPMVAMFLRNKIIAWAAVLIAVQHYLNEPPSDAPGLYSPDGEDSSGGLMKVLMSIAGLLVSYMDLVFPQQSFLGALTGSKSSSGAAMTTRLSAPKATVSSS